VQELDPPAAVGGCGSWTQQLQGEGAGAGPSSCWGSVQELDPAAAGGGYGSWTQTLQGKGVGREAQGMYSFLKA